jgi:hypothetical protein
MTRRVAGFLLLTTIFTAFACGKGSKVQFNPYDQAALDGARNLGKPVVIYATADW